ncbi:MAG: FAD-dependent thymidylate synthase [Synergistaceae bacterium]|jgi:thymidylate synthase (FAD)|nr:FAD-dependent thymidylate synthase [Synergistaceae bacterium]
MPSEPSVCKVFLLAHTPEPDELVAAAARICYSDVAASDLLERESAKLSRGLLAELWRSGHHSPFEHASFTFGVDGLSRVASHQLVRHRVASFSQQSQRYVRMDAEAVVLPPTIAGNPQARALFEGQVKAAHEACRRLVEMGVPAEDARFILPHGWETRLVLTMNARELHHFFALRLCRRAQWEIRTLARLMLVSCRAAAPVIFETAGPSCVREGECRESRPCGRPYKNMEDLLESEAKTETD